MELRILGQYVLSGVVDMQGYLLYGRINLLKEILEPNYFPSGITSSDVLGFHGEECNHLLPF